MSEMLTGSSGVEAWCARLRAPHLVLKHDPRCDRHVRDGNKQPAKPPLSRSLRLRLAWRWNRPSLPDFAYSGLLHCHSFVDSGQLVGHVDRVQHLATDSEPPSYTQPQKGVSSCASKLKAFRLSVPGTSRNKAVLPGSRQEHRVFAGQGAIPNTTNEFASRDNKITLC